MGLVNNKFKCQYVLSDSCNIFKGTISVEGVILAISFTFSVTKVWHKSTLEPVVIINKMLAFQLEMVLHINLGNKG